MAKLTMEQLQEKIERWQRVMPEKLKVALTRAAVEIIAEVQESHLSGPKMRRGVGGTTRATLAVRTGRLRKSIHHRITVSANKTTAQIGTNLVYGRIHEYGGTISNGFGRGLRIEMPERAYLRPSVRKMQPRVVELLLKGALEDSYGK